MRADENSADLGEILSNPISRKQVLFLLLAVAATLIPFLQNNVTNTMTPAHPLCPQFLDSCLLGNDKMKSLFAAIGIM